MPLVILALGIVVLFILIIGVKLNSFLSLILVSLGVGLAEGLPLLKVFDSIESGGGNLRAFGLCCIPQQRLKGHLPEKRESSEFMF